MVHLLFVRVTVSLVAFMNSAPQRDILMNAHIEHRQSVYKTQAEKQTNKRSLSTSMFNLLNWKYLFLLQLKMSNFYC